MSRVKVFEAEATHDRSECDVQRELKVRDLCYSIISTMNSKEIRRLFDVDSSKLRELELIRVRLKV